MSVFFLVSFAFYLVLPFSFQPFLMFTSAPNERSMSTSLCYSSLGSVVTSDYVTPLTGYEPKKDLNLTDAEELDLATTSDIYFQHTLDDTASFNDPEVDDNQLAEFLAVVVYRTGKPVEMRSNNDQFSCDIRNVKSAQNQFSLFTQPERMISQTGGLFKKGSLRSVKALTHRLGQCWMNSEERLSQSVARKFLITNSLQLKQNKIAEFYRRNYFDNRIFVKFISKIL